MTYSQQVYRNTLVSQAFKTFRDIGDTSSRTEKEKLLKDNWDNEVLQTLLERTYNPFRVYGIKKIPVLVSQYHVDNVDTIQQYELFLELLDKLESRQLTGNAAKDALADFLTDCTTAEEYHWYTMVVKRDLKIGITDKTINKISKGHIPVFTCMLAHPYSDKKLPSIFFIEPKLDGYRCLATVEEKADGTKSVILRSRNGKELTGYTAIENDLTHLPSGHIYDGEIMSGGTFADTQKNAFKKSVGKEGIFHIFDAVHTKEFVNDDFITPFSVRRFFIDSHVAPVILSNELTNVSVVNSQMVDTEGMSVSEFIADTHKEYLDKGYEGSMIKDFDGFYAKKRSWAVQKVKDMKTIDLVVVGVHPGLPGTALEGTLGALIVEYKGNHVYVGSGYTLSERNEIWSTKEDAINRTIEIQYFEETVDSKTGKNSLRFPVFKGFRYDK